MFTVEYLVKQEVKLFRKRLKVNDMDQQGNMISETPGCKLIALNI